MRAIVDAKLAERSGGLESPQASWAATLSDQDASDTSQEAAFTFDSLYIDRPRRWLAALLVAFMAAASSYALFTPAWQAPDEPAHFNYIAHLAQEQSLPVLRLGDYNQDLLETLLSSRFRAEQLVTLLRYEYHQPPLYYLLAAPVYWISGGSLMALRLFSAVIGAGAILLLYLCLELVFPTKTLIVVGGAAFAALLPMHVAILSSVNNDGLAELLVMASVLSLLTWMRGRFYCSDSSLLAEAGAEHECRHPSAVDERRQLLLLGLLLGLGMLTKVYAYILAPILLLAVVMVVWMDPLIHVRARDRGWMAPSWASLWSGMRLALWAAAPAAALGGLWWVRNWLVYGAFDFLGLAQHGRVVAGQPRTLEWISVNGWIAYSERAFSFTFQSFWGVFGWMGVFMDQRVYTAFLLFTGVIFLGVLWAVVRLISGRPDADMDLYQLWVLGLFGVMFTAVLVAYMWYNIEFVQHQGRYFFWGLLPIGAIVALGWREVMQPLQGLITAVLTLVVASGTVIVGTVTGAASEWTVLMTGAIALTLMLQALLLAGTSEVIVRRLPMRLQRTILRHSVERVSRWARVGMWASPFVLMFALNLMAPQMYIIPQLAR